MRDTGHGAGHGPAEKDTEFEAVLRELLGEQTEAFRAGEAPVASIVRQGRTHRRRRMAAAGAGLAVLAALPGTALAVHFQPDGRSTTALPGDAASSAATTASAAPQHSSASPPVSRTPSGPEGPLTAGQLTDGITLKRAGSVLEKCLAAQKAHEHKGFPSNDLDKAEDYRVILAMNATGDENSPGDGINVVAVEKSGGTPTRLICTEKKGAEPGVNASVGADPERGRVQPDINAFRLYKMDTATGPGLPYVFPFRWGSIGTVEPGIGKVTVAYGGVTQQAVLDHGYFVATGVLTKAVSALPHIQGYDTAGKLVYDSAEDKGYE
ncbi:hypothetical protein ACFYXS_25280 [Streptomyces sp. NPDC002574]|uniref:hypothetical protein n=1 Tax=Streptomyces sp. NPDC002574 TaxID=3364652 RepID=UPI0036980731